jgi:hypothetical protein
MEVSGEWSPSRPDRFTRGTHWIGGCVGPTLLVLKYRTHLDTWSVNPVYIKMKAVGNINYSKYCCYASFSWPKFYST